MKIIRVKREAFYFYSEICYYKNLDYLLKNKRSADMPRIIDTIIEDHTNDEALRGYNEHLQEKERLIADAAARALALTQGNILTTPLLDEEQRNEPHEYTGFGD